MNTDTTAERRRAFIEEHGVTGGTLESRAQANKAQHSPLPWKVMADPSYTEGLHPLHHNRYIATEAMGVEGDDFDGEGSLICALRDQEHQAGDAALIVRAVNNCEALAYALERLVNSIPLAKLNVRNNFSLLNNHAAATKALYQYNKAKGEAQ